jgi:hypothetical protein
MSFTVHRETLQESLSNMHMRLAEEVRKEKEIKVQDVFYFTYIFVLLSDFESH